MSKHTPGPWSYHDKAAYGLAITTGSIAAQNIASVQAYVGLTHDAARANARLIAAAPELLEALKYLASSPHGEQLHDAFDMAQRAIAKAEGEA
jgi:hypothetical protein